MDASELEQWLPYWGPIALGFVLSTFTLMMDVEVLNDAFTKQHRWAKSLDRVLWVLPFVAAFVVGFVPKVPVPEFAEGLGPLYWSTAGAVAVVLRKRVRRAVLS